MPNDGFTQEQSLLAQHERITMFAGNHNGPIATAMSEAVSSPPRTLTDREMEERAFAAANLSNSGNPCSSMPPDK